MVEYPGYKFTSITNAFGIGFATIKSGSIVRDEIGEFRSPMFTNVTYKLGPLIKYFWILWLSFTFFATNFLCYYLFYQNPHLKV